MGSLSNERFFRDGGEKNLTGSSNRNRRISPDVNSRPTTTSDRASVLMQLDSNSPFP
jgi:hypothetical protein